MFYKADNIRVKYKLRQKCTYKNKTVKITKEILKKE